MFSVVFFFRNASFSDKLLKCLFNVFPPLSSQAFFKGKLKIAGNMGMAMKLQNLQIAPGKAKLWDLEQAFVLQVLFKENICCKM